MIYKLIKWWQSISRYAILDPRDNSVTLSKALFKHIKDHAGREEKARVFVFRVSGTDLYGFMVNPDIRQETQMCEIQYNDKYHCIGFESLCPSVTRILYDYGLSSTFGVRLSVSVQHIYTPNEQGSLTKKTFYQFERPKKKMYERLT